MNNDMLIIAAGLLIGVGSVLLIIVIRFIIKSRKPPLSPREQALRLEEDVNKQYARQRLRQRIVSRLGTFVLTGILGGVLLGVGVWDWSLTNFGSEWPLLIGEITNVNARQNLDGGTVTYDLDVNYAYIVDARAYNGLIERTFTTQAESDRQLATYQQAGGIPVYYHPAFPQIHVNNAMTHYYVLVPIVLGGLLILVAFYSLIGSLAGVIRLMRI